MCNTRNEVRAIISLIPAHDHQSHDRPVHDDDLYDAKVRLSEQLVWGRSRSAGSPVSPPAIWFPAMWYPAMWFPAMWYRAKRILHLKLHHSSKIPFFNFDQKTFLPPVMWCDTQRQYPSVGICHRILGQYLKSVVEIITIQIPISKLRKFSRPSHPLHLKLDHSSKIPLFNFWPINFSSPSSPLSSEL